MKADEHGDAIRTMLASTDAGVSVREMVNQIGCSRQRVYQWLTAHAEEVQEVGKGGTGGALYKLRTTKALIPLRQVPTPPPARSAGAQGSIENTGWLRPGATLQLVSINGIGPEGIEVTLQAENGQSFTTIIR